MTREEIIIEGRRKEEAGDFNRQVVKRVPFDLHMDKLTLSCGHHGYDMPSLVDRVPNHSCEKCAAAWMTAAAAKG